MKTFENILSFNVTLNIRVTWNIGWALNNSYWNHPAAEAHKPHACLYRHLSIVFLSTPEIPDIDKDEIASWHLNLS